MIMVASCASAMNRVAAEPVVEADGAEARAIAGRQRSVVQIRAEVAPMHVGGHFALVADGGQELARELVHRTGLRTCDLDGAVQRRCERQLGQVADHVVRGNRLEQRGRQPDHITLCARFDDAADELEELRRAQDRIGNAGRLDQILLGHLGAEVATVGTAVAADDRQRQMMLDAGGLFAAIRLRPEVSKNSSTALSSHTGAFARSTTTSAPESASFSPSPVLVLKPAVGAAAMAS